MTTPRVTVPVEPTDEMIEAGRNAGQIGSSVAALVYEAMLTAAPVREEGGALDDRLHNAISKLKDWVSLIQLRKNGGCVSGNPIVDCVNDLPVIIRELEAAELEIEGAFEALEDAALATREEAPADSAHPCYDEHQAGCDCEILSQSATPTPSYLERLSAPAEAGEDAIKAACVAWHQAKDENPFNVLYHEAWCGSFPHQTGPERWTFTVPAMKQAVEAYLRAQPQAREGGVK